MKIPLSQDLYGDALLPHISLQLCLFVSDLVKLLFQSLIFTNERFIEFAVFLAKFMSLMRILLYLLLKLQSSGLRNAQLFSSECKIFSNRVKNLDLLILCHNDSLKMLNLNFFLC